MKKYMKNKDFIPEKFYNKKELNNNKREKGVLVLFLILNLILIPITAKSIGKIQQTPIANKEHIFSSESDKIDINNINKWIKSMINDDIEDVCITKDSGEIIVDNLEKIDGLSLNNSIEINEMNLNNDGKYKLGVSLNE